MRELLGRAHASRRDSADEAERYLYRALALAPDSAEVHLQLGDLFRDLGRHEAALNACEEAVRCAPASAQARNNLGNAFRTLGRDEDAVEQYRRAIALDAKLPEAHFNLAVALQKRGENAEALLRYRTALQGRPDLAAAHLNLGMLLEEQEEGEAAMAAYRTALSLEPGLVEAHVNLGMQLLLVGRYAEGWPEYEWRLRYPEYAAAADGAPRWDGTDAGGRTVLLDAEQGFGDAIQFVRYAPLVAARGARVILRCAPELAGLLRATPGVAEVVERGATPPFDLHCPLPSVPGVFGTTLENIPAGVPYVIAEPARVARWRSRLADAQGRCRVGLVWASQSKHRTATAKSMALEALAPLGAVPGTRFYSLQKGDAARAAPHAAPGLEIIDLSRDLLDFADTAAALGCMDLVISVDTAVAHLAGAMARPAWTLLKRAPDWRWLLGRDDCPWYPTMRLFRQREAGNWQPPVAAMAAALREFVAARASTQR